LDPEPATSDALRGKKARRGDPKWRPNRRPSDYEQDPRRRTGRLQRIWPAQVGCVDPDGSRRTQKGSSGWSNGWLSRPGGSASRHRMRAGCDRC